MSTCVSAVTPRSRTLVLGAGVALLALVLRVADWFPVEIAIETLRRWGESGGRPGMIWVGAGYVVLALLFVPGAVLTALTGAIYGVGWGVVVVGIATSVADAVAFLVARYLARPAVMRWTSRNSSFKKIDYAISRGGWRIVALVRLNPTIPYSASNYLFGVTGVPFLAFMISSGIATLPGALVYLYVGQVGAETLGGNVRTAVELGVLAVGLVMTIVAGVYVSVLARLGLAEAEQGQCL